MVIVCVPARWRPCQSMPSSTPPETPTAATPSLPANLRAHVNSAVDIRQVTPDEAARRAAFAALLEGWRVRTEQALAARLPAADVMPARLHEAMRYSVLGGGKRVRPAL